MIAKLTERKRVTRKYDLAVIITYLQAKKIRSMWYLKKNRQIHLLKEKNKLINFLGSNVLYSDMINEKSQINGEEIDCFLNYFKKTGEGINLQLYLTHIHTPTLSLTQLCGLKN